MDFFQFLQSSKEKSNNKLDNDTNNITNNDTNNNTNNDTNDITNDNTNDISKKVYISANENKVLNENCIDTYKNIRKGSMVKIIYVKNSILNSYKGYIGEVKNYKYGQDFALVFLHGIQHKCIIKFPLKHLIHIE